MICCLFGGSDFEFYDSVVFVVDKNQRYVIKFSIFVMQVNGFREWVEQELFKEGINILVMGGCIIISCV